MSHRLAHVEAEQRTTRDLRRVFASLAGLRGACQDVVVIVCQVSLHEHTGRHCVVERDLLGSVTVVDDLDSRAAVGVGESGNVESSVVAGGVNAVGTLTDELLAEMGVSPETSGGLDDVGAGGVDVDETFVGVVLLRCAPPVEEAGDVADGEGVVDVVGPGQAVALGATLGVPNEGHIGQSSAAV